MAVSTHSRVNVLTETPGASWWALREALVDAGWTQEGSCDGSTFANDGPGPVVGPEGLGANAWLRMRDPAGRREFVVHSNNSQWWIIVYSPSARFTDGASTEARPTAPDEVFITLPTFESMGTPEAYTHAIVEDTPINGVYGFWLIRTAPGASTRRTFVACDPLAEGPEFSRFEELGAIDDPCVWHSFLNTPNPSFFPSGLSASGNMTAVGFVGLSAQVGLPVTGLRYDCSNGALAFPNGMNTSPWNGGDDIAAMIYARPVGMGGSATAAFGVSAHLSIKGIPAREYPDVVEHSVDDLAWVYYHDAAIPWPKGITPAP